MPQINNDDLYPITSPLSGCTWIGSSPTGQTVQFSFDGMVDAIVAGQQDVLHFENATTVGQTVVGNRDPQNPDAPGINNGKEFIGTILTLPATNDSHISFIYQVI